MTLQHNRSQGFSARLLSTPTSCGWAALAFITAAPSLLCNGPTRHPICETSIAIVRLGGRHTTTALIRTTLAVNSAAPLLLCNGPARHPICESIGAIVRIGWWRDRLRSWHNDGLRAATVVDSAAPLLLIGGPSVL